MHSILNNSNAIIGSDEKTHSSPMGNKYYIEVHLVAANFT